MAKSKSAGFAASLFTSVLILFTSCSHPDTTRTAVSDPPPSSSVTQMKKADPPPAPVVTPTTTLPSSSEKTTVYYVDLKHFKVHNADSNSTEKLVLLTFDDGPKGVVTNQILDILDKYNAKSIWFINGFNYGWDYQANPQKAEKFRNAVKQIHDRGHLIGNHTWEHENLRKLSPEKQRKEILSMNELIESITGEKPKYFRPPFGAYTDVQKQIIKEQQMQSMNWSVGSLDWEYNKPEQVVDQVLATIHNGANILMHDLPVTADALDPLLKQLTEKGYQFVLPTEVKTE